MDYMHIGGRDVPLNVIAEYCDFIRDSKIIAKRLGWGGYEHERARLHNRIFNVAGFPDTKWGSARKTAAWFQSIGDDSSMKNDPDVGYDESIIIFHEKLERVISKMLNY